jgi:hypothetical protein
MKTLARAIVVVLCLLSLVILPGCGGGYSTPIKTPPPLLSIVTSSLPDAAWQTLYTQTIQASGGVAPYTWKVSAGAPPHNLAVASSTTDSVVISGTPDVPAQGVSFSVMVTDSANQSAVQAFSISVITQISVAVAPTSRSGVPPNKTQAFKATVTQDSTNKGVTWTVVQNGTSCSPACGTMSPANTASGAVSTYTAPATVPSNSTVSVTATSVEDATRGAAATVVIGVPNAVPLLDQSLSPAAATSGSTGLTLTLDGTGFTAGSVVNWNGGALTTTFVSKSQLTATVPDSNLANPTTASITVFNPGPGGGTSNAVLFPIASAIPAIALATTSVAASTFPLLAVGSDFNRDGKQDLTVAYADGTVGILVGAGDGTFSPASPQTVGAAVSSLEVGDFNGDGNLDVAATSHNGVSVMLGDGSGNLQPAANYTAGTSPTSVTVGDFNADGLLDLAVANQNCTNGASPCGAGTVSILLGAGDGTFLTHVDYPSAPGPNSITAGDFNGDGILDLAVAAGNGGVGTQVSILLGNGDGSFQNPVNYGTGTNPVAIATADFNNDHKLDLAVVNNAGSISILLGNGDGTFQTNVDYNTGSQPEGSLAVGDFNGDAKLDLAVADNGADTMSVLLGNGDGTFQPRVSFPTGQKPVGVAAGDFNGQGRLGFAVANQNESTVSVLVEHNSLSLSASSLSFGTQLSGTPSGTQTETLTNISNAPLTIGVAVTGTNTGDFGESDTCVPTLAAGASCTILVTFTPAQLGPRTATITVTDDSADSPESFSLDGIGVTSGPNATFSPATLTFATQLIGTTSSTQSVTLNNYGTAALNVSSIGASAGFAEIDNCHGTSLASGANCTVTVTFSPTALDTVHGTLSVTDNAPASPQAVPLSGAGTVVQLVPARLGFGCAYIFFPARGCVCTPPKATTLTNTASTTLDISGITVSGLAFSEVSSTCGSSLTAGQSCSITVRWSPSRSVTGIFTGDLDISDNGGASPQRVPLTGNKRCR